MRSPYVLGSLIALHLLLAGCADGEAETAQVLLERRAALGLAQTPLKFADAMAELERGRFEALLARVGSRRLGRDEVLDAAVRIENLLARADPATAGAPRAEYPAEFDAAAARAREQAAVFAHAAAAGAGAREQAERLLTSCIECHVRFRKLQ